jgi:CMP-N-acetylneuraminic acid synthetase
MKKPIIAAVVPVRKNSERLKNKNFLKFYKGKSLLEIKIQQLKNIKYIDRIVVSSDSKIAEKIAKKNDVFFHKREKFFASSKCSGSDFFQNLAQSIECDYLGYFPCTSPIIKKDTYLNFLKNFLKNRKSFDSFNSVTVLKKFLWKGKKTINYKISNAPNSQNLPDDFYTITFGLNIISRKKMIKYKNIVGKKPQFFLISKIESSDIDDAVDFDMIKSIYPKFFISEKK